MEWTRWLITQCSLFISCTTSGCREIRALHYFLSLAARITFCILVISKAYPAIIFKVVKYGMHCFHLYLFSSTRPESNRFSKPYFLIICPNSRFLMQSINTFFSFHFLQNFVDDHMFDLWCPQHSCVEISTSFSWCEV